MQKKEKKPGLKVVQTKEVKPGELVDTKGAPIPKSETEESGHTDPEQTQRRIALRLPDWLPLNGDGKVVLQMERRGDKKLDSGIWIAPNPIDVQQKFQSPIPSDAMFFIVAYDPDINYRYRKDKLKTLDLNEKEPNKLMEMADGKKYATKQIINMLDNSGDLDICRIGDECIFNIEHFTPVRIKDEFEVYYVIHHIDILGTRKVTPRLKNEMPQK